jgi:hypothetical protein
MYEAHVLLRDQVEPKRDFKITYQEEKKKLSGRDLIT